MSELKLSEVEKLFTELIAPFYEVIRDIVVPINKRRQENDAEHSWMLAFLSCALAHRIDPNLDIGKVCQFAVVHDLVEVYAGDTSVWSDKNDLASKEEREKKALNKIKARFKNIPWIAQTIKDYESKKSNEAKYVYAIDKFNNNLLVYMDKNKHNLDTRKTTKEDFDMLMRVHRKKAHTHKGVAKIYDELVDAFYAHPEYFHEANRG